MNEPDKCVKRGCDNDAEFTYQGHRFCYKCWEHCGLPQDYVLEMLKDCPNILIKKEE